MSRLLLAVCGGLGGFGLWLIQGGLRGKSLVGGFSSSGKLKSRSLRPLRRWMTAFLLGIVTFVVTGWFSAGVIMALGIGLFAGRFAKSKGLRKVGEKADAIAGWIEMLYAILASGGGLEKAIIGSAKAAPSAIREEVSELAGQLEVRPLPEAMASFAARMNHPAIDKVAASLILTASQGAADLVALLRAQAEVVRSESRLLVEADAGRAKFRTSARLIVGTTAVITLGLYLLDRGYLASYDSVQGQLVLAVIGSIFLSGFWLLSRLGRMEDPPRFFNLERSELFGGAP